MNKFITTLLGLALPLSLIAAPEQDKKDLLVLLVTEIENIAKKENITPGDVLVVIMFDSLVAFKINDETRRLLELAADQTLDETKRYEFLQKSLIEAVKSGVDVNESAIGALEKLTKKGVKCMVVFPTFGPLPAATMKQLNSFCPTIKSFAGRSFTFKNGQKAAGTFSQGIVCIDLREEMRFEEILKNICEELKYTPKRTLFISANEPQQ